VKKKRFAVAGAQHAARYLGNIMCFVPLLRNSHRKDSPTLRAHNLSAKTKRPESWAPARES